MKRLNRSLIILAALTAGLYLQLLQTQCIAADIERISVEKLRTILDSQSDVIIVDTRSERSFEAKHIPGAISIPYPDGTRTKGKELPRDKTIIFYCT